MHFWRGYRVTSGVMSPRFKLPNRKSVFYSWYLGGARFDGQYREFDYYVGFKYAKWSLDI